MIKGIKRGVALGSMFLMAGTAWSTDWHELRELNETELAEKISQFEKKLIQDPFQYQLYKALGIALHITAEQDAIKGARGAVQWLTKAYAINKLDNQTLCYLGSANTLMATTTWNPIRRLAQVRRGIAMMDQAVRSEPNNIRVRIIRAANSRRLPSFLNRGDLALEDFEHLAGLIDKNPDLPRSIKKTIYTNLAELYMKGKNQSKAQKFRELAGNLLK